MYSSLTEAGGLIGDLIPLGTERWAKELVTSSSTLTCVPSRRRASPTFEYICFSMCSASSASSARRFRASVDDFSCWDLCRPPEVDADIVDSTSSSLELGRGRLIKTFTSRRAASRKAIAAAMTLSAWASPSRLDRSFERTESSNCRYAGNTDGLRSWFPRARCDALSHLWNVVVEDTVSTCFRKSSNNVWRNLVSNPFPILFLRNEISLSVLAKALMPRRSINAGGCPLSCGCPLGAFRSPAINFSTPANPCSASSISPLST